MSDGNCCWLKDEPSDGRRRTWAELRKLVLQVQIIAKLAAESINWHICAPLGSSGERVASSAAPSWFSFSWPILYQIENQIIKCIKLSTSVIDDVL